MQYADCCHPVISLDLKHILHEARNAEEIIRGGGSRVGETLTAA